MKKFILIFFVIFSFSSFGAALVQVDEAKKVVTISANLFYYGKEANKINAKMCTDGIIREWAPLSQNQTVSLGTKNNLQDGQYKIQLVVNHEVINTRRANAEIEKRKNFANNYIEIPRDPSEEMMNAGGNVFHDGFTGSIYNDGIIVDFKICAHEFGHLLGLGEMNDTKTPPTLMTQAGIKTPFPEFQVKVYDPRFFSMDVGTFDIRKRKISMREINEIKRGLEFLSFTKGQAVLNCYVCQL